MSGLLALAAVLFLALLAALQGAPTFRPVEFSGAPGLGEQPEAPLPTPAQGPELGNREPHALLIIIAITLGVILGALLAFVIGRALLRVLRRAWNARALRQRSGASLAEASHALSVESDAPDAARMLTSVSEARATIEAAPGVADAIIAAWLALERGAEDAGYERAAAETPAEFVLRIVSSRHDVTEDLNALFMLYDRVRFGAYVATESDRDIARRSLGNIERAWR